MKNTIRSENGDIIAMRAMAKVALKTPLKWRRHGIGLLQAYLQERYRESDPEVRIHIWHPSLRRDGIVDHGDIHNHRFDFTSTVLVGEIIHIEYDLLVGDEWGVYEVVNARKDIGARYKPSPIHDSKRLHKKSYNIFSEGDKYFFKKGAFHRSFSKELCVTVVTKTNQSMNNKALIVAKLESPPIHAFELDDNFDKSEIIEQAILALDLQESTVDSR